MEWWIIANKCDLSSEQEVSDEEAKFVKEYNMKFFKVSTKDNLGINELKSEYKI